jgi:LexA DNA binding domain-containing protein
MQKLTKRQIEVLKFLKSRKEYTSVIEIMTKFNTTRAPVQEHLNILVEGSCVHKRPGPGRSFVYKWLRDEPLRQKLPVDPSLTPQDLTKEPMDTEILYSLAERFSQLNYLPKNHDKFPRAIATVFDELNNATYGVEIKPSNLNKARKELVNYYETLLNAAKHVGNMVNTSDLWDPQLLPSYLEDVSSNVPLDRLTDMVDDIRNYNPEL